MRTQMVAERIGEDMGPIDWTHPTAKDMPEIWREAEAKPDAFMLDNGGMGLREIYAIRMYDGWPYWTPRPAILYRGPLGAEWTFFDTYGIRPLSIVRKADPT